jgi:hypothetical protein
MTRLGMCYSSNIGRILERIGDGRRMSMVMSAKYCVFGPLDLH